ncbi:MAG: hypothetical protein NC833_01415 [Candidatus Omnitrophica bacterium]|nr:hypothetical protein [Candidatus Omnitrophota bacterium]
MKKSKRILGISFSIIFSIFIFSILIFKFLILKNIKYNKNWGLKDINLSLNGINLKDLTYKDTWISVKFDNIKIRPSIIKNAFAFEGQGQFRPEFKNKKVMVEGKIKGNITSGNLNVTTTDINIEDFGNFKFYGELQNWGKDRFDGIFEVNGLKIKEISEMTKYKIPFDGKIYGKVLIEKEKENFKGIKFDIEIEELNQEYEKSNFNLSLKGKYLPQEKKGFVENGLLINEKGEKLSFNGYITEDEFEFYFNTKEFSLYEFLKLLPEEIRKRYNLKIEGSKVSLNRFLLNYSKKKFILMAICSFNQNISNLKILN